MFAIRYSLAGHPRYLSCSILLGRQREVGSGVELRAFGPRLVCCPRAFVALLPMAFAAAAAAAYVTGIVS